MKTINELLVITEGFPNPANPYRYTFVEQLIREFSKKRINVTVINPVYHNYKEYQYKEKWSYEINDGYGITVYQPLILNFSMKKIGPLKLMDLSYRSFYNSIKQTVKKNHLQPDAIYSHFVFPSGCAAADLGKKMDVPSFCATGESNLSEIIQRFGSKYFQKKLASINGFISVSSDNKKILSEEKIVATDSIIVLPNGADQNVFYPHDKKEMRQKLGIPNDKIIGVFVGTFSERKGILRVNKASNITSIPMIYIGTGEQQPTGNNIVFAGGVQHHHIPEYLSAADFFVLPTQGEGCCNAIIEAICCGLPVISSIGDFNDDILNESYSIRINPNDVSQIANAMEKISKDAELRKRLSDNAMLQRERFNLTQRAESILKLISEVS